MAKMSTLRTDPELEIGGVWKEYEMGIRLKIARAGNANFDAEVQRLTEPYLQKFRRGRLPKDILEKITLKAAAKTILLDWEGIDDESEPLTTEEYRNLPDNEKDLYRDTWQDDSSEIHNGDEPHWQKIIPYSYEQAETYFKDERLRDMYKFVLVVANNSLHYREQSRAEAAKNSSTASSGS